MKEVWKSLLDALQDGEDAERLAQLGSGLTEQGPPVIRRAFDIREKYRI